MPSNLSPAFDLITMGRSSMYYLNFLAGSAQSLANTDDPEHAWIKQTWREKDPRVPVVSLVMEKN